MLGPIISENDPPFFAPWVTSAHKSWKKSEALHLKGLFQQKCPFGWIPRIQSAFFWPAPCLFFRLWETLGMCDQQRLRSACPYAQFDQSLCWSLKYSMSVKLLTEHHFRFLNFKEAAQAPLSLHLSKCHIRASVRQVYAVYYTENLLCTPKLHIKDEPQTYENSLVQYMYGQNWISRRPVCRKKMPTFTRLRESLMSRLHIGNSFILFIDHARTSHLTDFKCLLTASVTCRLQSEV